MYGQVYSKLCFYCPGCKEENVIVGKKAPEKKARPETKAREDHDFDQKRPGVTETAARGGPAASPAGGKQEAPAPVGRESKIKIKFKWGAKGKEKVGEKAAGKPGGKTTAKEPGVIAKPKEPGAPAEGKAGAKPEAAVKPKEPSVWQVELRKETARRPNLRKSIRSEGKFDCFHHSNIIILVRTMVQRVSTV